MPCRSGRPGGELRTGKLTGNLSESLRFFDRFGDFNANSCSNSSVLHPLSLLRTEQGIFRAETGNIFARNQEFCSVQFHRIPLRLHDQDGVAILRGRRSFAKSRRGGDRWGSVSAAACPREPRRRNEHNATTLVRREPASGSGFNLLRIAAYSYIVNPDLAYGRVALPRILAPRRRNAPPGPFSSARRFCTSKVAPNQRPAFARRGPLTKVFRLCRRHAVDVGGRSESDPYRKSGDRPCY